MASSNKLSLKQRRRGLIFAELLRCAASAAPDEELRRETLRYAGSVERRYGFTLEQKKESILIAIGDGACTEIDLRTETGFNPQDINEIVRTLEKEGHVRTERHSIHGTGRPSRIIKLNGSKIRNF